MEDKKRKIEVATSSICKSKAFKFSCNQKSCLTKHLSHASASQCNRRFTEATGIETNFSNIHNSSSIPQQEEARGDDHDNHNEDEQTNYVEHEMDIDDHELSAHLISLKEELNAAAFEELGYGNKHNYEVLKFMVDAGLTKKQMDIYLRLHVKSDYDAHKLTVGSSKELFNLVLKNGGPLDRYMPKSARMRTTQIEIPLFKEKNRSTTTLTAQIVDDLDQAVMTMLHHQHLEKEFSWDYCAKYTATGSRIYDSLASGDL
jgi:hypothetical protein